MAGQVPPSPGTPGIGVGTAPGRHCSQKGCNALDFLPFVCDGCGAVFCGDHRDYAAHGCRSPGLRSREVPRCPLCQTEVALKPGQTLDQAVNDHIVAGCKKQPGKGKTYGNQCSKKGCKKRELIPVNCKRCGRNFCLAHRFEADHKCAGTVDKAADRAAAAERRRKNARQTAPPPAASATRFGTPPSHGFARGGGGGGGGSRNAAAASVQGGMSEEDALAMALAASAAEAPDAAAAGRKQTVVASTAQPASGEDADLELALAMSASMAEQERQKAPTKEAKKDCRLM
mmetsp:Transcript_86/g.196  ORF Transcript_86/g.196 Transcript_86/m.196 type:complete len:287 (-) Transcript_86:214-1074(-)